MNLENITPKLIHDSIKVGKVFENVLVQKKIFGDSYSIKIGSDANGFLHKIHAVEPISSKKKKH